MDLKEKLLEQEDVLRSEACAIKGVFAEIKMTCLLLKKKKGKKSRPETIERIERLDSELNRYIVRFYEIKDELTGSQFKELESIIHDTEIKNKNEKIAEKILSFGSNVASGILGNILSNPLLIGF